MQISIGLREMERALLDIVFRSEKRKNILLLLHDGARGMEDIFKTLGTSRQALLPQMKILEESHLVAHYDDTYELTPVGKLIVGEMALFIDTADVFDTDIEYWGTRNLDFMPPHLFKRISELRQCKVVNPSIVESYEIDRRFYEATKRSRSHSAVTALLHPNFTEMAYELIDCGVRLDFVISRKLYDKLIRDNYSSLAGLLQNELVRIFVFPGKMDFKYVSYNDHCIMLALIRSDGSIDNSYLLCSSTDTLQWGKEFFEYYVNRSVPLTEI